jgi:hypothetical protein
MVRKVIRQLGISQLGMGQLGISKPGKPSTFNFLTINCIYSTHTISAALMIKPSINSKPNLRL